MEELTLGEYRVGKNFNPSSDPTVTAIKVKAAEFMDLINTISTENPLIPEKIRLATIALDQIESAAMFAVKAATKK